MVEKLIVPPPKTTVPFKQASKLDIHMEKHAQRLQFISRLAAVVVAAGGFLVLIGWMLRSSLLTSFSPGLVPMNPLTALLFVGSSACIALHTTSLRNRKVDLLKRCLAGIVFSGGLLTLQGFISEWHFGLDRVLFSDMLGTNRMAPNTALYFTLVGIALLTAEVRWVGCWPSQTLAIIVLGGALVSLLGYVYGASNLYGVGSYIPMALNTALLFAFTTVGLLCISGERGFLMVVTGSHSGSAMARRLLPTAVIVPCILGFLRIVGQRDGLYETEFGTTLMVIAMVVLLVMAVVFTAGSLNRLDIERSDATEAWQSQSQVLQSILENMGDGVVVADPHGKFTLFNPAAERILGMGASDVGPEAWTRQYGCFLSDGVTPYPAEQLPLARTLRGESVDEVELFIRNAVVSQGVWISITGRTLREASGELRGGVIVIRDISERKRAEEALQSSNLELERRVTERTKELADANRDLAQKNQENEMFVYSVSHDLRSPLVNLQGFSRELATTSGELRHMLAESELPPGSKDGAIRLIDQDMRESIRFIQTAVTRLAGIIDALLRLSRAGRIEYQMMPIDTGSVVARVVESMSGSIFEAGAAVRIADLPPAYGDPTAVEQIFANLIGNALKYCDPSRPCEIEVGYDPVEADVPVNCKGAYYVRDNGLGIPEAYLPKVFQAFKRLHPNVASGEGMGLAIVRRMVERHGGKVWVKSTVGAGSTFFVTLPLPTMETPPGPASNPLQERMLEHENAAAGHFAR